MRRIRDFFLRIIYDHDMKVILAVFFPIFVDQFMICMIGLVHMAMISNLGSDAMSGVGLVGQMNAFIIAIAITGLTSGTTVVVSQYVGARDLDGASRSGGQGIFLSTLLSIVVALVLCLFPEEIFTLCYCEATEEVKRAAVEYLVPLAISFPAFAVFQSAFSICRGYGDNRICLVLTVFINVFNLAVSYVFIYLFDMGIAGAGWGYIISRGTAAAFCMFYLLKKKYLASIFEVVRVHLANLKNITKIGMLLGMEGMLFNFGKMITIGFIIACGTHEVAANTAANSIFTVIQTPYLATGIAAMTLIGRYVGAGEKKDAKTIAFKLTGFTFFVQLVPCALVMPFLDPLVACFTDVPEVASLTKILLIFSVALMPIYGALVGPALNALRGAGDNGFVTFWQILSMWVMRIGLCYIIASGYFPVFAPVMGAIGVWIAQTVDLFFKGSVFLVRMCGKKWLEKRVVV